MSESDEICKVFMFVLTIPNDMQDGSDLERSLALTISQIVLRDCLSVNCDWFDRDWTVLSYVMTIVGTKYTNNEMSTVGSYLLTV